MSSSPNDIPAGRIQAALAELSKEERLVVILLYAENLTVYEAAEVLGTTPEVLTVIHFDLKERIKRSLELSRAAK